MQEERPRRRPEQRQRPERPPSAGRRPAPQIPDEVTGVELDRDVRAEVATLGQPAARQVARHLVMAGQLLDSDPELAWEHADAARRRAGRIGVVREAAGLTAYGAGRYADALAELRAARRLTGSDVHLPVMADCERGLGRPERALALAASEQAARLDRDGTIEMLIVAAGARLDMGQPEAAVLTLQVPQLSANGQGDGPARLRSAYADALAAAGREAEAATWRQRAREADLAGTAGLAGSQPDEGDEPDDVMFLDALDEDR